jgi:hypothetical protein
MSNLIPMERIESRIFLIRGQKVMIDRDLAKLYGVETFNLNKAVKRNSPRFPKDFMFRLSKQEYNALRFQFGMLKKGAHSKYLPHAFTENGVAMLSSVLRSERAIQVNIAIMRTFTRFRRLLAGHKELAKKIGELERKYSKHEVEITIVFKVLKKLMISSVNEENPKRKIGFVRGE